MKNNNLLTSDYLVSKGFKLNERIDIFDNFKMPYYVRNNIVLFFNSPVHEFNINDFYIGYAEMSQGKYYAVAFRWIKTKKELIEIFKAINNIEI